MFDFYPYNVGGDFKNLICESVCEKEKNSTKKYLKKLIDEAIGKIETEKENKRTLKKQRFSLLSRKIISFDSY